MPWKITKEYMPDIEVNTAESRIYNTLEQVQNNGNFFFGRKMSQQTLKDKYLFILPSHIFLRPQMF